MSTATPSARPHPPWWRRVLRLADTLLTALGVVQLLLRVLAALARSRARAAERDPSLRWQLVVEETHAVELYLKAAAGAARTTGVLGYEALRDAVREHGATAG